jgi:arsenite-transporting ATPase
VLAISVDPAHSLGDALGVRLAARPKAVRVGRHTLTAIELDGARVFRRWLRDHRHALGEVLEHGTWLDRDDIEALLALSIPGIDELVALLEIVRLAQAGDYHLVVVDTAPTGHTLRLLAAPAAVVAVAEVFEGLQREHRLIREQLARVGRPDAADRLIALLAGQARETGALLRDPLRTDIPLGCFCRSCCRSPKAKTASGAWPRRHPRLRRDRQPGAADGPPCRICDRRRRAERASVGRMAGRLNRGAALKVVRAALREPRGVAALARIGRELREGHPPARPDVASRGGDAMSAASLAVSLPEDARTISPEDVGAFRGASLLLFGGKGGVGKTTVAAATAVRLARAAPSRTVLLLSIDPAHSLSDAFNAPVGNRAAAVSRAPTNLHLRELDAPAALAARRTDLEAALNEIAEALGADGAAIEGERGASELMDLAPPGIDELFGILEVADLMAATPLADPGGSASAGYDLIVIDTAPTGHALRLLETPRRPVNG